MTKMRLFRAPASAAEAAACPEDRAPRGRNALQDRQQQASRQKILEAGAAVFGEKSYMLATVEDIVEKSGVSRVTFYKYFENKFALAKLLTNETVVPSLFEYYDRLADCRNPDIEDIHAWIDALVDIFSKNRRLIALLQEIAAIELGYDLIETSVHAGLIERLGKGIPAFKAAASAETGQEIHVRAHLLMRQLDRLCYDLGVNQWATDRTIAVRLLAEQFQHFIRSAAAVEPTGRPAALARGRRAKSL